MVSVCNVSSSIPSSVVCLANPLVLPRPEVLLLLLLSSFIFSPRVTFTVYWLLFFLSEDVTVIINCVVEPCFPKFFLFTLAVPPSAASNSNNICSTSGPTCKEYS